MKIKHIIGLILFGIFLRHLEDIIELGKVTIVNQQAESAAGQQIRMNQMMEQLEPKEDGVVVKGFCLDEVNEDEGIELETD